MTTQWGAPLTGAQMKLLRAAGLPAWAKAEFFGAPFRAGDCKFSENEPYRLPADHIAYTLAKAGWLDGRNVALWFGGEKAPDDWDGKHVLFRDGEAFTSPDVKWIWGHIGSGIDIIAYTRKAEIEYPPANEKLKEAVRLSREMTAQPETVTIAKMTEAEARKMIGEKVRWETFPVKMDIAMVTLDILGLIREPTRLERFWATRDTKDVYGPPSKAFQLIEEALNFEK